MNHDEFMRLPIRQRIAHRQAEQAEQARQCAARANAPEPTAAPESPAVPVPQRPAPSPAAQCCWRAAAGAVVGAFVADLLARLF
jgi:hypothetical protein